MKHFSLSRISIIKKELYKEQSVHDKRNKMWKWMSEGKQKEALNEQNRGNIKGDRLCFVKCISYTSIPQSHYDKLLLSFSSIIFLFIFF